MHTLSPVDIAILAAESLTILALLASAVIFSRKLKKLRRQNEINHTLQQKDTLDDLLTNDKLKPAPENDARR